MARRLFLYAKIPPAVKRVGFAIRCAKGKCATKALQIHCVLIADSERELFSDLGHILSCSKMFLCL